MSSAPAPVTEPQVRATFVLLFAVTPDQAPRGHSVLPGLDALPADVAAAYTQRLQGLQQRLLGEPYLKARRLERRAVGRLALPGDARAPSQADVYLVQHKSGAAVWEVWLNAPPQGLAVARWVSWFDMEAPDSLARRIWACLRQARPGSDLPELALPLALLQFPDQTLDQVLSAHGSELVKLLHRDPSPEPFKASFVQDELAADFCRRDQGLSLLSRNGAIDAHAGPRAHSSAGSDEVPQSSLPLLVTLELLCLERAVLRSFLDRFARGLYGTVTDLVELRRAIFDGLEEYYGTLARTTGYTAEATQLGESLFGINDLFDSVVDRLGALTFEITTRNQQEVNRWGFWLTTSFGAIETGFVAASIATWHYADDLFAVLAWTVGVTLTTALLIGGFLRSRLHR